jgi:hypothetical protein
MLTAPNPIQGPRPRFLTRGLISIKVAFNLAVSELVAGWFGGEFATITASFIISSTLNLALSDGFLIAIVF